MTCFGLMTISV